jgi:pimeloyl-ACP methyl ester carboxylesterase
MDSRVVDGGGGTDIRVDAYGPADAQPVVLLHGYSQSRLAWREQYESPLADDYRLVVPDLRGHGASSLADNYDDPELWAADVEAVLDAEGAEDAVLVGWSYAGLVAMDYVAQRGTDRLAGLVLVDAVVSIGVADAAAELGETYVGLMDGLTSGDAVESVAACEALVRLCRADEPDSEELYTDLGYTVAVPPSVRDALRARVVDHEDVLAGLDVPALVVQGTADAVVLAETAERYAEMAPDAELVTYAGVGHSPFREVPDQFDADLRRFVDGL